MKTKVYIVTKQEFEGSRRKLGFISKINNDLYYDFLLLDGSHDSYHKDGSEWRTSPATNGKAKKQREHVPLANFTGMHQLGMIMLTKDTIPLYPPIKESDFKKANIFEIDIDRFPSDSLNILIEMIEQNKSLVSNQDTKPPENAVVSIIKDFSPWIIISILGHDNNLLVKSEENGFVVNHINKRYSANVEGAEYLYESYTKDAFKKK